MNVLSLPKRRGFSLVELVIVVVILGIIGAIAVPRMSRGAAGAADSGLVSDLAVMRAAIEYYAAEHGGAYPTLADFEAQLTTYTDDQGNDNATKTAVFQYGPYLRAVPTLKVGSKKGQSDIGGTAGGSEAWLYDAATGEISAMLVNTELDSRGVAYSSY